MKKIYWTTEKRKISDLIEHENNPRQLSKKDAADLKKSLEKFNYAELIAINADNTILAGHQRVYTLKQLGRQNEEIEVRVPSRQLTDREGREYLIRSNKNAGAWDYDLLSNWDIDEICEWGFTLEDLGMDSDSADEETKEEEEEKTSVRVEVDCKSLNQFEQLKTYLDREDFQYRKLKK